MDTTRIEVGSPAFAMLVGLVAQADREDRDISIAPRHGGEGYVAFKIGEGMWTGPQRTTPHRPLRTEFDSPASAQEHPIRALGAHQGYDSLSDVDRPRTGPRDPRSLL